jgi:polyferredoxin
MRVRLSRLIDVITSRMAVRLAFLAFFVWACTRLLAFAAWARGTGPYVPRPEAVAGLLPVGHFTSFFAWVRGGGWDTLLPAGLVIILLALTLSLLFKRGFCGWICPLGTVWESAGLIGRKILGRNLRLPRWLDLGLRGLRYAFAAALMLWLLMVPLDQAVAFRQVPYMWVADIKILDGLISPVFIALFAFAFIVSMLFGSVWCRYLCPLGGLYGAVGAASLCTVRRDSDACISCGKCSKVCHAGVDVAASRRPVRAPECDGCMDCVRACPAPGALDARGPGGFRIDPRVWMLIVVTIWMGGWGVAKVAGSWDTTIPNATFKQAIDSGVLQQSSMPQAK